MDWWNAIVKNLPTDLIIVMWLTYVTFVVLLLCMIMTGDIKVSAFLVVAFEWFVIMFVLRKHARDKLNINNKIVN